VKLSILIVNWNSTDYLRACLQSILDTCSSINPQVIVVDGGSFDGCDQMLATEFPWVEFLQSRENIGFGRSNNLGFGRVTGDALLLLNPDTVLQTGAVGILLEALSTLPDVGMVGAHLLNSDGTLQMSSVHPLPNPVNAAFDLNVFRALWWRRHGSGVDKPFPVEAVSGACMMMRAGTFRDLGGFNPRFFMYAEDMDLCFRVQQAGLAIFHAPNARIVHHGGGSSATTFSKFPTVMICEALQTYMVINRGLADALAYRVLILGAALLRLPLLLALSSQKARRARCIASIHRSIAALRWSVGLESWAREHFLVPSSERLPLPSRRSISTREVSQEEDDDRSVTFTYAKTRSQDW